MTPSDTSYRTIPLTQGYEAIVDSEDYESLIITKWCADIKRNEQGIVESVYAWRGVWKPRHCVRMHRFVLGITDPKILVDHRNRDTLDNRRGNLRVCNNAMNQGNRVLLSRVNTSGYRGVFPARGTQWSARLQIKGKKQTHLGTFPTAIEAAIAYDVAALDYFGEFARLNFPDRIAQ